MRVATLTSAEPAKDLQQSSKLQAFQGVEPGSFNGRGEGEQGGGGCTGAGWVDHSNS